MSGRIATGSCPWTRIAAEGRFHRAGREWTEPFPEEAIKAPTIIVFDGATGEVIGEWGRDMFVMPHGLTIDDKDNVWVTDVGRHQVFKLTHDGDLLLALGTDRVPGADSNHFNLPTDLAVLPDGDFYISHGYANSRVAKFSAAGQFLFQWGIKGSGPGQFDLPHGIAIDGGDQPLDPPDRSRALKLSLDGKVEAMFGRFGNYDGQFRLGHDIAVAEDGAIYIVDAWGMRVQKFLAR